MSIHVTCDVPGCESTVQLDDVAADPGRFEHELEVEGWWIRDKGDFTFICGRHPSGKLPTP